MNIGGQAVLEGVMMRTPSAWAVAVRRPDGRISTVVEDARSVALRNRILRWPVIRGVVALGWLEATGVSAEPLPEAFAHERDAVLAALIARAAGRPAAELPGVAENRAMFHRLGVDPTKTRPSSEAL